MEIAAWVVRHFPKKQPHHSAPPNRKMRRTVADSDDDEDDEIIVGADGSDLTRNLYAEDESLASFEASIANLDGTVDKSTGSTGET